jgi:hypothetical protein
MKKGEKVQKYTIRDFTVIGTPKEIQSSLSRLAFELSILVSGIDAEAIDDDEQSSSYDDGVVSCTLYPMA